ncbi:MAG: Ig-like domain-containing protein [Prevotella sp.]|nr:Ig-like domain-containing protein [Prevotella sp.]
MDINQMTVDELAQAITREDLRESAQQIRKELQQIPFLTLRDKTSKYITILPGVRNQLTLPELDGDAELAPYSTTNREDANYEINGRTLVVYPGNCAYDFDPMPLFHSIWGESIAMGEKISKQQIARKLVTLFAAKIGMHLNDVAFFGGVRNKNGKKTKDLFDSFGTIIAQEITAGNISVAKGNYIKLGAIDATNAEEKLKEFWRAADKMLKGMKVYMYMSPDIYMDYCDDYQARHGALPYNKEFEKRTLEGSEGRCEFAVLDNMAGRFLFITIKQNLILGTDIMYQQNAPFIGSYSPWAVTFAYAGVYGEQIRSLRKEFLMVADLEEDGGDDSQDDDSGAVVKEGVSITFTNAVDNAVMGGEYAGQVASVDPAGKTLVYTSSNESVATVNSSTGAVTLVAAGTTLITASFAGDDTHYAAQGSYALTVTSE